MLKKVYIIEDEPKAILLLKRYFSKVQEIQLVGYTRDPIKAYSFLQENDVDILFLDIELPNISGIEFYKSLNAPPMVVFITAHPEHAVEAFTLEAIDYLLKPLTFFRFLKTWDRITKQNNREVLNSHDKEDIATEVVYVKSGSQSHRIFWREVVYLEKDENYVIYYTQGKKILSRQTLQDLEKIFPDYILRIHKSYAVSLLYVETYSRNQVIINDKKIPIGSTYRNKFNSMIDLFKT